MKLAIVGSRNFQNEKLVRAAVRYACQLIVDDLQIVSGGAKGVDTWAVDEFIKLTGRSAKVFNPKKYPGMTFKDIRDALFLRNKRIVDSADAVLAFWTVDSTGTANTVTYAKLKNLPVKVFTSETPAEDVMKAVKMVIFIHQSKKIQK